METKMVRAFGDPEKDLDLMKEAGDIIKRGGLVAMPTETVYGLAGNALDPESSKKIYAAKGRPSDNPLIVHIADMADLAYIVKEVPEAAKRLGERFWPGPLTMIMRKSDAVPYETTGGLDTVAVRFPSHPVACEFIKASGGYIAAPSANLSGRPSPTTAEHCMEDLGGRIDMIIDGGKVGIGIESTIVDLTSDVPCLLRPGYVSIDMLREVLGHVDIDPAIKGMADESAPPKAPGMKYRHYAPKGLLTIVRGEPEKVRERINALVEEKRAEGKKTAVIATSEQKDGYDADFVMCIGHASDIEEVAGSLFAILRSMDEKGAEYIYSEAFEEKGLGEAVMNRLKKAAGYRIMDV